MAIDTFDYNKLRKLIKDETGINPEDEHFDVAREVICECARIAAESTNPSQDILEHFGL